MTKILDHYEDAEEFEEALEAAESNARGERAEDFLAGLREKYEEWGEDMFLSDAQNEWLQKLADGE